MEKLNPRNFVFPTLYRYICDKITDIGLLSARQQAQSVETF